MGWSLYFYILSSHCLPVDSVSHLRGGVNFILMLSKARASALVPAGTSGSEILTCPSPHQHRCRGCSFCSFVVPVISFLLVSRSWHFPTSIFFFFYQFPSFKGIFVIFYLLFLCVCSRGIFRLSSLPSCQYQKVSSIF